MQIVTGGVISLLPLAFVCAQLISLFIRYPLKILWSANINLHVCPQGHSRRQNQAYVLLFYLFLFNQYTFGEVSENS